MKTSNYNIRIIFMFLFALFSSCETLDLEQTEDPSSLNPSFLDPVSAYNYVQLALPRFVDQTNSFTQRVTRQMAMTGGNNYDNAFAPVNFNQHWSTSYKLLNAIKSSEPRALSENQFFILGANKLIRCYVLLTLVDLYGDIPYTEALQGNKNLTPKFDNSAAIYKVVLGELDDAVAFLNNPKADPPSINLYYSDKVGWIKLANTLKLKIYNNSRLASSEIGITDLASSISSIVNSGNFIKEPSDDFQFNYGNSRFNPNTRHPLYNNQYELGGGAYISNYLIWTMTTEKDDTDAIDPRLEFYFYKQTDAATSNLGVINSLVRPNHYTNSNYRSFYNSAIQTPFILSNWVGTASAPAGGFWGRDHGDNSGIPQDATFRTVGGVYPIGGKFGVTASSVQTGGNKGGQGAGIIPIILSSYVHFILAESNLTIGGLAGNPVVDARSSLNKAISQSFSKVTSFLPAETKLTLSQNTALTSKANSYLSFIGAKFDDLSNEKRLELIIKEYFIASWGNGIEPYNNYRRTGYPSNFQPTVELFSGDYYYTAFYPGVAVNNNPNAPLNNVRTRKVFWDKSNLILH